MVGANKVPVLCRFGGKLVEETNKVCYKDGTNRLIYVDRGSSYSSLLSCVHEASKSTQIGSIKYQYPELGLDCLVSIDNNDDVSNMMQAFSLSCGPIQLFVFEAQKTFSMLNAISSDKEAVQAIGEPNESEETPLQQNLDASTKDGQGASNDSQELDCFGMHNHQLPSYEVDAHTNDASDKPAMKSTLSEGKEFASRNAFDKALREHAICSNFEYKRTRSGNGRFAAKCIQPDCSWRISAFQLPNEPTIRIKSLKGNHTCNTNKQSKVSNPRKHRQATRRWIADIVEGRMQKDLSCTPRAIISAIGEEYGIVVSYEKVWRGKALALEKLHPTAADLALRKLCRDIDRTNPGSRTKLTRSTDNSLRLFIAYKAAIRAFELSCRPAIKLDSVKVKAKCPYRWLIAVAFDVDAQSLPIACGFVESENEDNRKWFCDELSYILRSIPKLAFIADRQEGFLEVASAAFPQSHCRYSRRTLENELRSKFEMEGLSCLFRSAMHAWNLSEFDDLMDKIYMKSPEAWNFLKNINPTYWSTAHFGGGTYDDLWADRMFGPLSLRMRRWEENNRNLPLVSLVKQLHVYMVEIFIGRLKASSNWTTVLVPKMEDAISLPDLFWVTVDGTGFRVSSACDSQDVDLERRTCSCRGWQIFRRPCLHANMAIEHSGQNIYDYWDECYKVAQYRKAYSEVIRPLPGQSKRINSAGEMLKQLLEFEIFVLDDVFLC